MDDLEEVVDLLNVCSRELIGQPEYTTDALRVEWTTPGFDFSYTRLILSPEGRPAG